MKEHGMPRNLIRCLSILAGCAFFQAGFAQDHNTGYYEKVYEDAEKAIWQLQWSEYFESVEYEGYSPGDFTVSFSGIGGGGYCDPDTGVCYDPQSLGFDLAEEDPYEGDHMTVTAPRPGLFRMFVMIPNYSICGTLPDDKGGAGLLCGGGGAGIGRPDLTPCNTDGWSEITEEKIRKIFENPVLKDRLSDLISNSISQNIEMMAVLIPLSSGRPGAYSFNLVGTDIGSINPPHTACEMNVTLPNLPAGSVVVHTHPFSMGDTTCDGGTYVPGPSEADWDFLDSQVNISTGLILDKDDIAMFKKANDGSENTDFENSCL